jgi:hypothetical protein
MKPPYQELRKTKNQGQYTTTLRLTKIKDNRVQSKFKVIPKKRTSVKFPIIKKDEKINYPGAHLPYNVKVQVKVQGVVPKKKRDRERTLKRSQTKKKEINPHKKEPFLKKKERKRTLVTFPNKKRDNP